MTQTLTIHLNWEGSETIEAIIPVLHQPCRIELNLAANYHHALFRHFHSNAPAGQLETLDEQGGAELLAKLAALGLAIDKLTTEQESYLSSWREGT